MTDILLSTATTTAKFLPIILHTDSAKPATPADRLVVIRFKEKKGSATPKSPSYCVSIPDTEVFCTDELLNKLATSAFQQLQDDIIRERVETFLEDSSIRKEINALEVNETAVSLYFDRVATSGRLSKDLLASWFDETLAEELAIALLNAVPSLNKDEKKLAEAIEGHKKHICNLASPRANMPISLASQLKKAVLLAKEEDGKIKPTLLSKLDAFINPPKVNELDFGL